MYFFLFINLALSIDPLYTWVKETDMQGLIPTPRGGHSAVLIGRQIFIFGGCNTTQYCYNDLHTYNTQSKTWSRLNSTGTVPSPRGDHTSVVLGTKILIFGGSFRGLELNDLYEYNAVTDHWVNLLPISEKPQGRSSAAGALDDAGNFFIVGGYSSLGYLNDVWVYSIISNKWTKFQTSGEAPTARELHSFTIQGKIGYLYGGFHAGGVSGELYILDIEMMNWIQVRDDGFLPEAREGHIAVLLADFLFVQGGCNFAHAVCYDDLYVLDLVTLWWVKLEARAFTALPAQKERAAGVSLGSEIIIFGGCYLDKHCFNDVIRINTGLKCQCNNNGVCRDGVCVCHKGYSGHDCLVRAKCKENCLGRGFCTSSADCDCYPGYKGKICEYESNCPNNCTGVNNGRCQTDGTCDCFHGYGGSDCKCECVHGYCFDKGCVCEVGWGGDKCQIETEYKSSSSAQNTQAAESVNGEESEKKLESQKESLNGKQSSGGESENSDLNSNEKIVADGAYGLASEAAEPWSDEGSDESNESSNFTEAAAVQGTGTVADLCAKCKHGTCSDGKCYCANGYTGEFCDNMSKGVALIYASSLTLVFMLLGAGVAYCCFSPEKVFREKEEFPLIREKAK